MTEEQRTTVYAVFEEIKRMPGGDTVEMEAGGFSVVRLQYIPDRKHYRMTNIGHGCDSKEIRRRMLNIFYDLMEAAGRK